MLDLSPNGHLSTTSTLIGHGFAVIDSPLALKITALQPGWSTVTFNYQLQEIGTVQVGEMLTASAHIQAGGFGINQFQQIQTTVPADQSLSIARMLAGTFTGSAFFDTIGSTNSLEVGAATSLGSVPEPETFWLLLGGLATLLVGSHLRKDLI
jgi:hypothetical protein